MKTIVLAQFDDQGLVSRAQAKCVLSQVAEQQKVIFDFAGVRDIGQAFADQIFRVYWDQNPNIELQITNASSAVRGMITRVRAASKSATPGPTA